MSCYQHVDRYVTKEVDKCGQYDRFVTNFERTSPPFSFHRRSKDIFPGVEKLATAFDHNSKFKISRLLTNNDTLLIDSSQTGFESFETTLYHGLEPFNAHEAE